MVGTVIHHYGIFIYTDVYKRIVDIALRDPYVLKLASPFKTNESLEYLPHTEVLHKLLNNETIFGSYHICSRGNITALDSRGLIFLDLIYIASLNSSATLAPIDALHFSPDPDYQLQLERERQRPWQVNQKPTPALLTLIEILKKEKRQK